MEQDGILLNSRVQKAERTDEPLSLLTAKGVPTPTHCCDKVPGKTNLERRGKLILTVSFRYSPLWQPSRRCRNLKRPAILCSQSGKRQK